MRRSEIALALASIALLVAAPVMAKEDNDADDVLLTQADLDPGTLLPAPPAAGSAQAQAEMAELHAMEAARSEADLAAAKHDSATKNASIFAEAIGPGFDLARLPATRALMEAVRETEKDAANRGKAAFRRPRPWIIDSALKTCSRDDDPLSSYPSGHTTMAYSMGAVLARLVPAKATAIMARAAVYGQSRIVCEEHFRSDVTGGEALGLIVAERLMTKPRFHRLFEAAREELTRAGLRS
jgi:acid phosphatase (class A)